MNSLERQTLREYPSNDMSRTMVFNSILVTMTVIWSLADASPCCIEALINCLKNQELDRDAIRSMYRCFPPESMIESYWVIDNHLSNMVDTNQPERNFDEVAGLLEAEIIAANSSACWRKPNLAKQLKSKNHSLMINSMLRLLELDQVLLANMACSIYSTRDLIENNSIARDSIGRRLGKMPNFLPRIDGIIFEVALRRAQGCIDEYEKSLQEAIGSRNYYVEIVKKFWDKILGKRLQEKYATQVMDVVFLKDSEGALDATHDMDWAIQGEEIGLILEFLDQMDASTPKNKRDYDWKLSAYKKYVERPCLIFTSMVYPVIESLEFDLQFKKLSNIFQRVAQNPEIAKHRAYYYMCKKLADENYRFVHYTSLETESVDQ